MSAIDEMLAERQEEKARIISEEMEIDRFVAMLAFLYEGCL